jgi:uncharacterized protein YecT (DUF1311 family)
MAVRARVILAALALLAVPAAFAQHQTARDAPCRRTPDAACFLAAAQDANKTLNDTYNRLWKTLASRPKQQAQLQAAQDLWLKTRSADCEAERDISGGGQLAYYACLESETRKRAGELPLLAAMHR